MRSEGSSTRPGFVVAVAGLTLVVAASSPASSEESDDVEFTDVRKHTEEFIRYYQTIELNKRR